MMKTKRFFSLLLSCLFVLGCLAAPAGAVEASEPAIETIITRATGRIDSSIPGNTILTLGDVSLANKEVVTYTCFYTSRDASVKFGYIGPDGLFYGLSGYKGSIDQGIQVNQSGTYTLAIWNKSDETVSVWGTVNY